MGREGKSKDERKGGSEEIGELGTPQGFVDTPMFQILKNTLNYNCIDN